jgi:hypothetical protein
MSTSSLTSPLPAAWSPPAPRWIQSPAFDLFFFIGSPLVMVPVVLGALYWSNAFALLGFVLAFAHYASSFTFYFWDENQARHRARWLAFFGGPLIITAVFCLLVYFRVPLIVQVVLFFWNAVHVARQSCGILSVYRNRAGVSDPAQKAAANGAILAVSVWLCLWNIETHLEVRPILDAVSPRLGFLLWALAGAVAVAALARAVVAFVRRARAGAPPALPELAIFATGIALFHPYLWIPDSARATFAMLLPHYLQYLGLVWLLHRRKFGQPAGSRPQVALHHLGRNLVLLVTVLGAIGLGLFGVKELMTRVGYVTVFEAFYLLVAFLHYYADGLFWAFRDPHVRRSIGPFLSAGVRRSESGAV